MTTLSGTADFNIDRDTIITQALEHLHVYGEGEVIPASIITLMARHLNTLIKAWHTQGIQLWSLERFTIEPVVNQETYILGPGGGVVVSATVTAGGTGYGVAPTVTFSSPGGSGNTATGTATVDGDAVTAITITDSGDQYTSRPTITFGGPGTGAAATSNMNGRFMTRPLRIHDDAFIHHILGNNDTPITQISRNEYYRFGNKTSGGQPNSFYYDPQLDDGKLIVWPRPNQLSIYDMRFTSQRPLQDITDNSENVDFPQEWLQAITFGLADATALVFGAPKTVAMELKERSNFYRQAMSEWDSAEDNVSVQFTAASEYHRGR